MEKEKRELKGARELRRKAEERLKEKPAPPKKLTELETQELIQELQVHQIELEMQNEELCRAQAVVEESRAKYSDLYDFAPVGYLTLNRQGLILEANLTACSSLGKERSLLISVNTLFTNFIIKKGEKDLFYQHLGKVFKAKSLETCELELKGKDNTKFYAQLESIVVKDNLSQCRTAITDITERRKKEEYVKKQNEFVETIINSFQYPFYVIGTDYTIILSNKAAKEKGVVEGGRCYQLTHRSQEPCSGKHICPLKEVIRTGKPTVTEHIHFDNYGDDRNFEVHCGPILDKDGQVIQMIEYSIDITERKKAEQAIKDTAYQFQSVVEGVGEGITFSDAEGKFLVYNQRMQEITGFTVDEANNSGDFTRLLYPEPLERQKALQRLHEIAEHKLALPLEVETTIQAKDGTKKLLWVSTREMRFKDQVMFLSIYRDITERKKAEDALRIALTAKSAFNSMVSHELRTPLGALKESVSQLFEGMLGPLTEDQKKFLGIAKRNVDRLARMVGEVLDFQTLETGKVAFKMQDNDINEVVKEIKETMNIIAKEKGLEFILNLDKGLPKIKFDRDKIAQVLSNLVNNSIKLTGKGSITISTTQGNNVIQVSVKDTGLGIKEEDIPRLFQQYEQLERKAGGTGLGLAISFEIIKAHGGKIWAESTLGQGTTMHFLLPIEERRRGI